jgi:hypothetical protein
MSNLHVNLDEANKHDPKGFIPAPNNTFPVKTETGVSYYEERMSLSKAINFVDGTVAPPTTADYDVYVLTGSGTEDAGWGAAVFGDWVRFLNGIPTPITPLAGYRCFDETSGTWKEYNGSAWVAGDANTTNLSIGTVTANNVDIDSDTGTNATIPTATASDAGVMPSSKFNEVVANNAKVSNATHTGEVTGSVALTVDKTVISNKSLVTADGADHVLIGDASDADNLKKVLVSDFLGGGGNLGDTNLTLSGATTRTYNLDGNELAFIDGANSILRALPTGIVVGTSSLPANHRVLIKGIGSTSGTTALLVENSAGTDALVVRDDGFVGVGLNNPNALFTVKSTSSGSTVPLRVQANNGISASTITCSNTNTQFDLWDATAVVRKIFLTTNGASYFNGGSVGIGLTSGIGSSLHIKGTPTTTSALYIENNAGANVSKINVDGGDSYFNGGNIGIGLTNPNSLFTVRATAATSTTPFRVQANNQISAADLTCTNSDAQFALWNPTAIQRVVQLNTNGDSYFNGGDLGIGLNTGINARVHVKGAGATSGTTALLVENNSGQDILQCRDDNAIAFYGGVPVVQATTGVAAAVFVANTSGIADDTATFDGYTLGQVVTALRAMGILQ